MPRITDVLLDTVFYIYPSVYDANNSTEYGGSGFWLEQHSSIMQNESYLYAVTNAHVINGIDPVLRVNTTDGKFDIITTANEDWIRHPDGDDLVVCHLTLEADKWRVVAIDRTEVIDDAFSEDYNIGPGDDVVMAGRFRVHAGKKRNLPTLSFGSIAAMNEELLKNQYTGLGQESYIVEMRSISGFSGSPVIVYILPFSFRFKSSADSDERESLHAEFRQKLLGIQWGHIQYKVKGVDESGQHVLINTDSAMAGVVPGHKIIELIDDKRLANVRRSAEEELQRQIDDADVALDSYGADNWPELTHAAFQKVLRKVSRPDKPERPPD